MTAVNTGPSFTNPVANSYNPELGYVADVQHGDGDVQCSFINLPATGGAVVIGQPMSVGNMAPAEWGQSVVASGAGDVHGYDYLGQPMMETFGAGGEGAKAFKWVTSVTNSITLTWGIQHGLPYAMKSEATSDTGTPADLTTPTATTGDPRGTVVFSSAPDGTDRLFSYTPYRPDKDTGFMTMHGPRHYYPASP